MIVRQCSIKGIMLLGTLCETLIIFRVSLIYTFIKNLYQSSSTFRVKTNSFGFFVQSLSSLCNAVLPTRDCNL